MGFEQSRKNFFGTFIEEVFLNPDGIQS